MFNKRVMMKICDLISDYGDKYPSALFIGTEYVMQNDDAQTDALKLVGDIMDIFAKTWQDEEW